MVKKILYFINNFFLIPFIMVLLLALFYIISNSTVFNLNYSFIIPSFIIIISLFILFLGFTGKSSTSFLILFIFTFLIFLINQLKIIYMGQPLFLSDFNFLHNTSSLLKFMGSDFFSEVSNYLIYFILLFLMFFILFFVSFKFNFYIVNIKKRLLFVFFSLFMLFMLFYPFSFSKQLYKSLFFNIKDNAEYSFKANYISLYGTYGIIGGMYYQFLDSRFDVPKDYNDEELDELLEVNKFSSDKNNSLGTPNIIVILAESFFDVSLLNDDIVFNKEVTYNFNSLKKKGKLINMISSSYGGMTANVTFELLTGANMSYFSQGYVPFMQLYNNKNSSNMPSIINDLKKNGYFSTIILGNDSYNSEKVFSSLGFDKYLEIEEEENNVKGGYVSDEYISKLIVEEIRNKKDKNFFMVETMQSHMDYYKSKYDKYDIQINRSKLSSIDNDTLLSYSQGIYDADKMLKEVYDAIQKVNEDTIVVFFGDHLPYLKNIKGENVIDKLSYFNTGNDKLDLYRLYNSQALILSNYDINYDIKSNISFDLLLTSLVNQMDIEISSYYKWLYESSDKLAAYNRYITIDKDGNLYTLNELSGEMFDTYKLRNMMTYKLFIK